MKSAPSETDITYAIYLSLNYSFTPAEANRIVALTLVTSAIIAEKIEHRLPFHVIVRTMTGIIGADILQKRSLSTPCLN